LAEFALEADAFGDLERRDDAALDLLPALSGSLASYGPDQAVGSEIVIFLIGNRVLPFLGRVGRKA
jgi:hypothetical protein